MKSRGILIFLALVVAGGGFMLLMSLWEPRYEGRALSDWLEQCNLPLDQTQRLAEAQAAVCAMPLKKVLPRLLALAGAKDDPVSLWMIGAGDHFRISDEFGNRFLQNPDGKHQWLCRPVGHARSLGYGV